MSQLSDKNLDNINFNLLSKVNSPFTRELLLYILFYIKYPYYYSIIKEATTLKVVEVSNIDPIDVIGKILTDYLETGELPDDYVFEFDNTKIISLFSYFGIEIVYDLLNNKNFKYRSDGRGNYLYDIFMVLDFLYEKSKVLFEKYVITLYDKHYDAIINILENNPRPNKIWIHFY